MAQSVLPRRHRCGFAGHAKRQRRTRARRNPQSETADAFEVAGVERLDDSAVVLRGRFKVRPLEQWTGRREFYRRIKYAFDGAGIEIPYPHVTVYARSCKGGGAP